jgi:DnaJ-class molecular chaperone
MTTLQWGIGVKVEKTDLEPCGQCGGTGLLQDTGTDSFNAVTCWTCWGTGMITFLQDYYYTETTGTTGGTWWTEGEDGIWLQE